MTGFKMIVKLLDCFSVNINITCKRHRSLLLKSCRLLNKRQFCSKKEEKDEPADSGVQKLLQNSSPLRSSVVSDFWASSPYPQGTIFQDSKGETDPEDEVKPTESVILFPGQGNQYIGMAQNLMKYPASADMFRAANEILGYDLLKICLEGPEKVLNDTKYCQPATFVCSLALLEKVKCERPWAISNCVATCGYSLGELTALVFAGCFSFEKGLRLVKKRSEAMAECCEKTPGGMLTILTGPRTKLSVAFSDAKEHCKSEGIEDPVCVIASYLFPNCKVIAGNIKALEFIQKNAKTYDIRRHSKLPVSGAFHTVLMQDAAETLKDELKYIELSRPLVRVFSNVTGKPYKSPKDIKTSLPKQIYMPVKWEQIMQYLLSEPKDEPLPYLYECGPGESLSAIAKKNCATIASQCCPIQL